MQTDYEKKNLVGLQKFGRTIHPKNGIIPLSSTYGKNSEKLFQWINDMAQGGLGLFLRKKTRVY